MKKRNQKVTIREAFRGFKGFRAINPPSPAKAGKAAEISILALCVLAAGVCFGCSPEGNKWSDSSLTVTTRTEAYTKSSPAKADLPSKRFKEETAGDSDIQTSPSNETHHIPFAASPKETPSAAEGNMSVCYVHICGEITSPGVYEIEEGSRIFQVIERAGGFTERAASQYLNMAQTVCDGMKIVVPDQSALKAGDRYGLMEAGKEGGAGSCIILPEGAGTAANNSGGAGRSGASQERVNLNTASKEELMSLKGIGEAKAADIIAYRESHGRFRKIEDIMEISGIKDAAFEKIKNDITV